MGLRLRRGAHPATAALRRERDRPLDHSGRGDVVRLVQLLLDDPQYRHDGALHPLLRLRVPAARSAAGGVGAGGGGAGLRGLGRRAHFAIVKAIFSSLSSENSKGVSAELISVSWCLNTPASFGEVAWSQRGLAAPVSSPRRHTGEGSGGAPLVVGGRWAHLQAPAEPRSAAPRRWLFSAASASSAQTQPPRGCEDTTQSKLVSSFRAFHPHSQRNLTAHVVYRMPYKN